MALAVTGLADVVLGTLSKYYKHDVLNLAQTTQFYASQEFFKRAKKVPGISQTWFAATTDNGSAGNLGYFDTITPGYNSNNVSITAPWKGWQFNLCYDIMMIHIQAGNEQQLFDVIKQEYDRAWLSNWGYFEGQLWDRPVDSTNAAGHLFGIPYWITMAGATSTFALSSTELTGFSAGIGGLTNASAPQWGNYQKTYTNWNYADGIDGLRDFAVKSNYKAPMNVDYLKTGGSPKRRIFTGLTVKKAHEDAVRAQNQNIGTDAAHYDNKSTFHGMPIEYVPQLDNAAYNGALYCLDMDEVMYTAVEGDYNRQVGPKQLDAQPNVYATYWMNQGQLRVRDRRANYVTATSAFGVSGRIL